MTDRPSDVVVVESFVKADAFGKLFHLLVDIGVERSASAGTGQIEFSILNFVLSRRSLKYKIKLSP